MRDPFDLESGRDRELYLIDTFAISDPDERERDQHDVDLAAADRRMEKAA